MKRNGYFIGLICLALVFGLFAVPAQVQANGYSLSLKVTDSSGNDRQNNAFNRGETLLVQIIADQLQGVAGCAFTLNYDANVLTAPTTDLNGVAATGITSLFPFTFVKTGHPDSGAVTMRENSDTAGKILFSGAAIDTSTGGAKNALSTPGASFALFVVQFTVKTGAALGASSLSLSQTTLNNTAAGYNSAGEAVPVLVGAVPNTDTTNWNNLSSGAFPILLSALSPAPTAALAIVDGLTVEGTITYTGKQPGTLKVGAFTSSALTTPVGVGFSDVWTGNGMAYSIKVPSGGGSYHIAAYIDGGASPNNILEAWEARGLYPSNPLSVSANQTGKNITLADPDVNNNGLPDWWEVKYGLYSATSPIDKNADYDHDGYSNLVEYQRDLDPVTQNLPGLADYNAATDTRSYAVSGTISYNGTQTGSLYVAAFTPTDTTFSTPIGAATPVTWSGTSKTYTVTVPNGTYVVAAFIDTVVNGTRDTTEAKGASSQFTLAGAAVTGKNFALVDATSKLQIVSATPATMKAKAGAAVKFDLNYTTSNLNKTLTGVGIRIHYNSSKLTWVGFTNVFGSPTADPSLVQPQSDSSNLDGDTTTDKFVVLAWSDLSGKWPNVTLPIRLFTANFTAAAGLEVGDTSAIRFTASSAASGYQLVGEPVTFTVIAINLDVDGNGVIDALTDGLLILRYLFDFRGDALISGAIGDNAIRTTAADIEAYLESAKTAILDLDGNGTPDALTDGLLAIRYFFDFREDALISGAIGDGATRTTAADIGNYIEQYKP